MSDGAGVFELREAIDYLRAALESTDAEIKQGMISGAANRVNEALAVLEGPDDQATQWQYSNGPVWGWFELSYAEYLTVPRRALCSMPLGWQRRFVSCLEELDARMEWRPEHGRYWVRLKDGRGRYKTDPLGSYRHASPLKVKDLPEGWTPISRGPVVTITRKRLKSDGAA